MSKGFNIAAVRRNLEQTKRELPVKLAKQAEAYFTGAFSRGGMEGEQPWQEVQRRIPGTRAWKYPKKRGLSRRTRPILIGETASLRRRTANSAREARWGYVRLVVEHPAAEVHNEGDEARGIPARPYMKQTPALASKQEKMITTYMDKVWKTN